MKVLKRLWYRFFQIWVGIGLSFYFRKILIEGKENLPQNEPVLILPNHQNSLVDAILPTCKVDGQMHYLVRADVFKNKYADKFLRSLNLMPVYRKRDGISELSKNEIIFNECVKLLENKERIIIFPEAGQVMARSLRSLSKGFTRIAFKAMEKSDFKTEVWLVPLGISYESYFCFHSVVRIRFGKAVALSEYVDLYKENPQRAAIKLTNEIYQKIKPLMVHFDSYEEEKKRFHPNLPGELATLPEYFQNPNNPQERDFELIKKRGEGLLVKITHFPVLLLQNYILVTFMPNKNFKPAVTIVSGLILFTIYYILILLISFLVFSNILSGVLIVALFLGIIKFNPK